MITMAMISGHKLIQRGPLVLVYDIMGTLVFTGAYMGSPCIYADSEEFNIGV